VLPFTERAWSWSAGASGVQSASILFTYSTSGVYVYEWSIRILRQLLNQGTMGGNVSNDLNDN
jgi:hypothetical protein